MEPSESSASQPPRTHSWAIRIFRVLGVILIAGALWMAEWSSIRRFFSSAEAKMALVPLAALMGLALVVSAQALKRGVSIQDSGDRSVYGKVHGYAHLVKAVLQMFIGIIAVVIVGWKFLHAPPPLRPKPDEETTTTATSLLLDGIGVGLAAAAVVELAYTLFTDGPDEALDPLMLGLSAAILIQLGGLDPHVSFQQAGGLLALGVLLVVLFATRLMLAERHDGEAPKVWWIRR
jgi:hypothetical protein